MKTILILLGLLLLKYLAFLILRGSATPSSPDSGYKPSLDDLYMTTASESAARASRVLPESPSEDASHLLVPPNLPPRDFDEDREYLPSPTTEWSIHVAFPELPSLAGSDVADQLTRQWRSANGSPIVYGRSADDGRWTYLISADTPSTFTELQFAWRLHQLSAEEDGPLTESTLMNYRNSLVEVLKPLGEPVVTPSLSVGEASERSRRLAQAVEECDLSATIVLKAPNRSPFDGREIWDVMHSLGLSWGDMDLFHWPSESSLGDDFFFSVWTSTPPGYFLPEMIAQGEVHTADLIFSYSIPRSAAPEEVLESMLAASNYAQKRLGGELLSPTGAPLAPASLRQEVASAVTSLRSFGFEPGHNETLFVF
jgi:cell division protein ZipA